SVRAKNVYTTPQTGVIYQPLSYGNDLINGNPPIAPPNSLINITFTNVIPNSNWTNPNNLITNQVSGTLAATSTVGSALCAPLPSTFPGPGLNNAGIADILLVPYGNSAAGTETAEWFFSLDSCQTEANYTPQDTVFSTTVGCQ